MLTSVYKMLVVILIAEAVMLVNLGYEWVELGYGLNPMFALPLAALCTVMAILMAIRMYKIYKRRQYMLGEWVIKRTK